MISNWCRALTARNLTIGAKLSSRYKKPTIEFYHPNFVARKFGLGQHIPLHYQSMVGALKIVVMFVADLGQLLKVKHMKLLLFKKMRTWSTSTIEESDSPTPTTRAIVAGANKGLAE